MTARQRTCSQTPQKVKFPSVGDAQRHIERTSQPGALGPAQAKPRRPYHCPACGWVHVSTIRHSSTGRQPTRTARPTVPRSAKPRPHI